MKAVVYHVKPVGWATCKWMRHLSRRVLTGPMNGFSLSEVPPPELPAKDWVRVKTRMCGICGSDTALVLQKPPPNSLLQAFTSFPMILGHETVAEVDLVGPAVDPAWVGRRVIVEPTLGCEARGTDPWCDRCAAGEFGACENFSGAFGGSAKLPAGTSIGYNSRTGGGWGEYFVAHRSQLVPIDDSVSDTRAVLVDPLACSAHAALRADLAGVRNVLVYGTGILGLGVVACLRAMNYTGRIEVVGRSEYLEPIVTGQGADDYIILPEDTAQRFEKIAGRIGGKVQRARFGNYMISGGYDVVFDCVGSEQSMEECLKFTRSRGQVVILGTLPSGTLDLTPMWFRELKILGAYGRQFEYYNGRRIGTYQLVLEWMASKALKVDHLLTHTFRLDEYRKALEVASFKSAHQAVKVAFDLRQ